VEALRLFTHPRPCIRITGILHSPQLDLECRPEICEAAIVHFFILSYKARDVGITLCSHRVTPPWCGTTHHAASSC
jgi:hypothetical protein